MRETVLGWGIADVSSSTGLPARESVFAQATKSVIFLVVAVSLGAPGEVRMTRVMAGLGTACKCAHVRWEEWESGMEEG